jgi:BCD family chlorophyll transporter-like MFS transporter
MFVYHLEILLLFAALVAIGPLVRTRRADAPAVAAQGAPAGGIGLAEMPG